MYDETPLIAILVVAVVLLFFAIKNTQDFKNDCRSAGGVPIIQSRGQNMCFPKGTVIDVYGGGK